MRHSLGSWVRRRRRTGSQRRDLIGRRWASIKDAVASEMVIGGASIAKVWPHGEAAVTEIDAAGIAEVPGVTT